MEELIIKIIPYLFIKKLQFADYFLKKPYFDVFKISFICVFEVIKKFLRLCI